MRTPTPARRRAATFFLGGPPHWAQDSAVPMMVSANALMNYEFGPRTPVARCRIAIDSAGFSQVATTATTCSTPTRGAAWSTGSSTGSARLPSSWRVRTS